MFVLYLDEKLVSVVVERDVADPGREHWNFLRKDNASQICFHKHMGDNVLCSNSGLLTLTKYPPASMKVMTVTEAKVVAFFMSINVAPIASPSPCHHPPNSSEIIDETSEVDDCEP